MATDRKIKTIVSTSKCGRKAQVITESNETKHLHLVSDLGVSSVWEDADEKRYRFTR